MLSGLQVIEDKKEWDRVVDSFPRSGIHFTHAYFHLNIKAFEKAVLVYMESEHGRVAYPFMLRDISHEPAFKGELPAGKYFDIGSPYGYVGHLIDAVSPEYSRELMKRLYDCFGEFCRANHVISEFIKFSPLLENHLHVESEVETVYLMKMVASDLQKFGDPLHGELKTKKRQDYNRAKRHGITARFEFAPKSLEKQLPVYYETMDRNKAYDIFYYSEEYFERIIRSLSDKLLIVSGYLDDKLIGFELCFLHGDTIYAHIGGTLSEYLKYSPRDFFSPEIMSWGHKNGYSYYYVEGGITSSPDDPLYRYKKAFAKNTEFDYYFGKKIWDQETYDHLVKIADDLNGDSSGGFFPAYRRSPRKR